MICFLKCLDNINIAEQTSMKKILLLKQKQNHFVPNN